MKARHHKNTGEQPEKNRGRLATALHVMGKPVRAVAGFAKKAQLGPVMTSTNDYHLDEGWYGVGGNNFPNIEGSRTKEVHDAV